MASKNDGTIQSRLQLDGEKEYKKALNDAYRSLRVLRSELKAETAELGKNATQEEKNAKKAESLKKQIAEQEKIVQTLTQALKDSKEQYADNQEVQDKWAEKLNKAREALAKMKDELEGSKAGISDISGEMQNAAIQTTDAANSAMALGQAFSSIGSIVKSAGSNLEGIASSMVDTIEEMVNQVISLMSKAWAAAGEWKEIQAMYGGNLEDIQALYRGMQLQGVDTSQVTGGMQKLLTNTHNSNKDTLEALKKLHISEKDYASHFDFYVGVMEKLQEYHGADQEKLTSALFGDKSSYTQNNVLANWQDAKNKYAQDIEATGLAFTSEEIEQLDTVSHKILEIQELWEQIQTSIGGKLSELLNMDDISEDVLEILRDIGSLMSGEGDSKEITMKLDADFTKLVKDVETALSNLSEFLKQLGGNLEESENPLLQFMGKLINSLGKIIDWIGAHGDEIITALEKILPAAVTNKVVEATTGKGIGDWVSTIGQTGLQLFGINKILGALGGGAASGTAAGAGAGAGGWLAGLGGTIGSAITGGIGLAAKVSPWLAGAYTLLKPAETGNDDLIGDDGNLTDAAKKRGFWVDENGDLAGGPTRSPVDIYEQMGIDRKLLEWEESGQKKYTDRRRKAAKDLAELQDRADSAGGAAVDIVSLLGQNIGNPLNALKDIADNIFASLENLNADKYTGDQEEEQQEITIIVNSSSYIDGELVAQSVDRHLYGGGGGSWRATRQ